MDQQSKEKRSRRIAQKSKSIKAKIKLIKHMRPYMDTSSPHRYADVSPFNCGQSTCVMCGNPRKFYKEITIQEKSFRNIEKYQLDLIKNETTIRD